MINTHSTNRRLSAPIFTGFAVNVRKYFVIISLIVAVLLSALGLVYVSDLHRQMMIKKERLEARAAAMHDHWGQLVKKQSQFSNQMALANEAKQVLAMITPDKPRRVTVT